MRRDGSQKIVRNSDIVLDQLFQPIEIYFEKSRKLFHTIIPFQMMTTKIKTIFF